MRLSTILTRLGRTLLTITLIAAPAAGLGGCNDAQSGSMLGAGVGALAGQALGGDTEATLLGTGIGAAAGYIVGNEVEKSRTSAYAVNHGGHGYGYSHPHH